MGAGDGCGKLLFNFSVCNGMGGYMPYWKSYSSDMGESWDKPQPISNVAPPGCARPWLHAIGNTVLLSGGRQRFAGTTDVSLWTSEDRGSTWTRYSLSGYHNMLVQNETYGGRPARFDAHVNSTLSPRETSSYTSLLPLPAVLNEVTGTVVEPASAIVMYDRTFYEYPDKPPASPFTGRNFDAVSIFAMRLKLVDDDGGGKSD